MSTRNNTTSIDPGEFSDRIGSRELTGNSNRRSMEQDKWAGQTKFVVIVLSRPLPVRSSKVNAFMNHGRSGPTNQNDFGQFYFYGRIHACPGVPGNTTPHSLWGNPCAMSATSDPMSAAILTKKHTKFISGDNFVGTVPAIGDIVDVELSAGWAKVNLQYAKFDRIAMSSAGEYNEAILQAECGSLKALFDRFDGSRVGDASMANFNSGLFGAAGSAKMESDIRALKALATATAATGMQVTSRMSSAARGLIETYVNSENNRWNGLPPFSTPLVENNAVNLDSDEYNILYWYWRATRPERDDSWVQNNVLSGEPIAHWSAVYISYIFYRALHPNGWDTTQIDNGDGTFDEAGPLTNNPEFASSSAHQFYMEHPNWEVYEAQPANLVGLGHIKAEIGDILLTVYNGANRPTIINCHGDVVYRIDLANRTAYLSGGNLSESVSISRTAALDADGNYLRTPAGMSQPGMRGPYYTIMKYLPSESAYTPPSPSTT